MKSKWIRFGTTAVSAGVLSCASVIPPEAPPREIVVHELAPPQFSPLLAMAPESSIRPPSIRLLEQGRFSLNVQSADLASMLLGLGRESPMNVIVGPGVDGVVTADLQDVSLLEILDRVVLPRGYRYEIEGNVLRVHQADRQTRTYRVDYPNYQRQGGSEFSIAGAIASKSTIGDGAESEDVSQSSVTTSQTVDLWTEIENAIRAIVFAQGEVGEEEATQDGEEEEGVAIEVAPRLPRQVIVSRQSALVTVTGEADVLAAVEAYLAEVAKTSARQILIDSQIIEVTLRDDLDLGVDYEGAPSYQGSATGIFTRLINAGFRDATFAQTLAPTLTEGGISFGIASKSLGVVLQALAAQTDVRVVSTPRIATLNNHKALIKVVRNEVFFVAQVETAIVEGSGSTAEIEFVPQIVPVGVTLDVTPYVSEDDEITMHIHPSVSEIVDVVVQPSASPSQPQVGSLPVIDLRETDTVLRVSDGTTIVIGGLVQSREFQRLRKVPFFGDIPILGTIFRNTATEERRTELIILLTPTVLDGPRIARVSEHALESVRNLDDLRVSRTFEAPWWRRPIGESYGVKP